jgi:putative toxin-antitoxin system antitoxin component (TIGR02293 family)
MAKSAVAAQAAKDRGAVPRVQRLLGLTRAELADALDVSPRTLDRRPLQHKELDRLSVLEQIGRRACEVVPEDRVAGWFSRPKAALDGDAPKELLRTETGRRIVEAYLERLIDGTVL